MLTDVEPLVFEKHAQMIVHTTEPLNSGPPLPLLVQSFVTPTEHFFVRTHGNVPELDSATFAFEIGGLVDPPRRIGLTDLRRSFPQVTVPVTLQCAGNRRTEMSQTTPIPGELPWGAHAISTAVWGGVPLSAVLDQFDLADADLHVAFVGHDDVERHGEIWGFGGSIPLRSVAELGVLLAYEMNGAPLTAIHGGPLRVIVPGVIGARSVKWLHSISIQPAPSTNYFQREAYRLIESEIAADSAPMLHELVINSVICTPQDGAALRSGPVTLQGYAITGGRAVVTAVDVSLDGGRSWAAAELLSGGQCGVWRLWQATVNLAPGTHECLVRATDSAGTSQPASPNWNKKGYLYNAWQRISLTVED